MSFFAESDIFNIIDFLTQYFLKGVTATSVDYSLTISQIVNYTENKPWFYWSINVFEKDFSYIWLVVLEKLLLPYFELRID